MSYYEFHVSRRYVQFEGALGELPRYAASIGRKILILLAGIPDYARGVIERSLAAPCAESMRPELAAQSARYAGYRAGADRFDRLREGMRCEFYEIVDVVPSENHVRRVAEYVRAGGFDTVVGLGGGRGMDFARAITRFVPVKVILVPTLAATNAPISTLSVIYSDDGSKIEDYWRMDNAPDLTLVDTGILLKNPPWALAAGIADITCTYYEGLCNLDLAGERDRYPALSYEGLKLAIGIMREMAPGALDAVRSGEMSVAFENVVSMIMHNCGPLWTACSMGLAHALDELMLYFEAAHRLPHGLRVGFATLPMLIYAGRDASEIDAYRAFCRDVGIPTTLRELGLGEIAPAQWREAAAATVEARGTLKKLPFEVCFEELLPCVLSCR